MSIYTDLVKARNDLQDLLTHGSYKMDEDDDNDNGKSLYGRGSSTLFQEQTQQTHRTVDVDDRQYGLSIDNS